MGDRLTRDEADAALRRWAAEGTDEPRLFAEIRDFLEEHSILLMGCTLGMSYGQARYLAAAAEVSHG